MDYPTGISTDAERETWDVIFGGISLSPAQIPEAVMLVRWQIIADKCQEDLTANGDVQVAYSPDGMTLSQLPQLATLKAASAEIRAISKRLHLEESKPRETGKASVLQLVINDRKEKSNAG